MHKVLLAEFGGTEGIRDEGLLESALAMPQAAFGGEFLHRTVFDQAAAYLFHLIKNHPFMDGNKRVAYAAMRVFLDISGYRLIMGQEEKYQLVMVVAEGRLNKAQIVDTLQRATQAKQGRV